MAELIHVSKVKIIKDKGPLRRAYIENFPEPVRYGVHGGIHRRGGRLNDRHAGRGASGTEDTNSTGPIVL